MCAGVRARINIERGILKGVFFTKSSLEGGRAFYFSLAAEVENPGEPFLSAHLDFFSRK